MSSFREFLEEASKPYHDSFKTGDIVMQPNKGREGRVTAVDRSLVYVDFGKYGKTEFQLDGRLEKGDPLPLLYLKSTNVNLMK